MPTTRYRTPDELMQPHLARDMSKDLADEISAKITALREIPGFESDFNLQQAEARLDEAHTFVLTFYGATA